MLRDFSFPPLNLPSLVSEKSKGGYAERVSELNSIASGAGKGSNAFARRKKELWHARQSFREITRVMTSSSYIRPLIDLWRTEPDFFNDAPPCRVLFELIERLAEASGRRRLTRLPLRELCLLFFVRYDDIDDLNDLGRLLCRQLDRYAPNELMFGMDRLLGCKESIFTGQGHDFLAKLAERKRVQPLDAAREYGIATNSRFFQKAQQAYYLHRLRSLAPNQPDDLLVQVRRVAGQPFEKPRMLGHIVMAILIDKLDKAGAEPSDLWMETILAIGGDPRVARTARSFRLWWQPMGEPRIQCMLRWLSKVDLELFLQICREYVGESSREDLARMYPDREKYLRWLFRQDLILQTRLFLGDGVSEYVRRSYDGKKFHYISMSGSRDLAVFYLEIRAPYAPDRKLHIVEGTFSFTLKIMEGIPRGSVLNDEYRYKYYPYDGVPDDRLRTKLVQAYEREFHVDRDEFSKRHQGKDWKRWVVETLQRNGISASYYDIFKESPY